MDNIRNVLNIYLSWALCNWKLAIFVRKSMNRDFVDEANKEWKSSCDNVGFHRKRWFEGAFFEIYVTNMGQNSIISKQTLGNVAHDFRRICNQALYLQISSLQLNQKYIMHSLWNIQKYIGNVMKWLSAAWSWTADCLWCLCPMSPCHQMGRQCIALDMRCSIIQFC
jgi:hypothetical protein